MTSTVRVTVNATQVVHELLTWHSLLKPKLRVPSLHSDTDDRPSEGHHSDAVLASLLVEQEAPHHHREMSGTIRTLFRLQPVCTLGAVHHRARVHSHADMASLPLHATFEKHRFPLPEASIAKTQSQ